MLLQKPARKQARGAERLSPTQQWVVPVLHVCAAAFAIAALAGDSDGVAACGQVPGLAGRWGWCSGHRGGIVSASARNWRKKGAKKLKGAIKECAPTLRPSVSH